MDRDVSSNNAGGLVLSFLDWFGGRTGPAPHVGTIRRVKREGACREAVKALYADTPTSDIESRQVRRAWVRTHAKAEASMQKRRERRARAVARKDSKRRAA